MDRLVAAVRLRALVGRGSSSTWGQGFLLQVQRKSREGRAVVMMAQPRAVCVACVYVRLPCPKTAPSCAAPCRGDVSQAMRARWPLSPPRCIMRLPRVRAARAASSRRRDELCKSRYGDTDGTRPRHPWRPWGCPSPWRLPLDRDRYSHPSVSLRAKVKNASVLDLSGAYGSAARIAIVHRPLKWLPRSEQRSGCGSLRGGMQVTSSVQTRVYSRRSARVAARAVGQRAEHAA